MPIPTSRCSWTSGFPEDEIPRASNCLPRHGLQDRCNDTGYKGRIGLFEGMAVDEEVRELILSGATTDELRDAATRNGMLTLRESGLEKIRNGVTSLEEVTRETFRH